MGGQGQKGQIAVVWTISLKQHTKERERGQDQTYSGKGKGKNNSCTGRRIARTGTQRGLPTFDMDGQSRLKGPHVNEPKIGQKGQGRPALC